MARTIQKPRPSRTSRSDRHRSVSPLSSDSAPSSPSRYTKQFKTTSSRKGTRKHVDSGLEEGREEDRDAPPTQQVPRRSKRQSGPSHPSVDEIEEEQDFHESLNDRYKAQKGDQDISNRHEKTGAVMKEDAQEAPERRKVSHKQGEPRKISAKKHLSTSHGLHTTRRAKKRTGDLPQSQDALLAWILQYKPQVLEGYLKDHKKMARDADESMEDDSEEDLEERENEIEGSEDENDKEGAEESQDSDHELEVEVSAVEGEHETVVERTEEEEEEEEEQRQLDIKAEKLAASLAAPFAQAQNAAKVNLDALLHRLHTSLEAGLKPLTGVELGAQYETWADAEAKFRIHCLEAFKKYHQDGATQQLKVAGLRDKINAAQAIKRKAMKDGRIEMLDLIDKQSEEITALREELEAQQDEETSKMSTTTDPKALEKLLHLGVKSLLGAAL